MPPSASLFVQSVILWLVVLTLLIGGIVRLAGRPAASVMVAVAIVFAISSPFFFYYRPPVYAHQPDYAAYRDAALGWPLIYAIAERDSGLVGFRSIAFFADLTLGCIVGILYLLLRRLTTRSSERLMAATSVSKSTSTAP